MTFKNPAVWKGKTFSKEHCRAISEGIKKRIRETDYKPTIPDNTGKHHSEKTKKQISLKKKGIKLSEETRNRMIEYHNRPDVKKRFIEKISNSLKGHLVSEETRKKISEANKGKRKGMPSHNKGKHTGKHQWNYKGVAKINKIIRSLFEYDLWRSKVFQRDNWTCQTCQRKGVYLEAHHIKEFATIRNQYNILTIEQALNCQELWDINNGVTLCKDCHNLTRKGRRRHNK